MSKEMVISSSRHETRLAIMEGDQLVEVFFQRENEYSLAGSIHKGRVTRVLPGMQSAFVDLGLERDTFLYVSDFYEDNHEDFDRLTDEKSTSSAGGGASPGGGSGSSRGGGRDRDRDRRRGGGRDRGESRGGDRGGERGSEPQVATPSVLPGSALPPPLPIEVTGESIFGEDGGDQPRESVLEVVPGEAIASASGIVGGSIAPAPSMAQVSGRMDSRGGGGRDRGGDGRDRDRDRGGRGRGGRRGRRGGGFPDSKYSSSETPAGRPQESGARREYERPVYERPAGDLPRSTGGVGAPGLEPLPGETLARFAGSSTEVEVRSDFDRGGYDEPQEEIAFQEDRLEDPNESGDENGDELDTSDSLVTSDDPIEHPSANAIPDAPIHEDRILRIELEADAAQEAAEREAEAMAIEDAVESFVEPDRGDEAQDAAEQDIAEEEEAASAESPSDLETVTEAESAPEGDAMDEVQAAAELAADGTPVTAQVREDRDRRYLRGGRRGRRGRGRDRTGDRGADRPAGPAAEAVPGGESQPTAAGAPAMERAERSERGDRPDRGERGDRGERSERGDRGNRGGGGDRHENRGGGSGMPLISDLLKEGQEIIVQIAKEPLGQKGARITSHIALPGRYVVYMPTLDHMGVSRKIASDEERQRLKRVLQTARGQITGGCIIRTAGEGKPEDEILADITFLFNLWQDIKQKADKRPAPILLHHDLDIVQRVLRDQLTEEFKSVWVDNEEMYESVLRFMQRFQPTLLNRVKLYTRSVSIFDAFNITSELEKALRPKVWLKSGGYIVINQTEALVAIDINTGKFVGKSNRLEDTIVKTNLEAVKEIVRQVRLRDLGGIIVIDFIDMDERRNRQKVMQALEESLRQDRAPFKVLQFNDFGLVAITRKRVKQSLERTMCSPCPYCEGAGYVKSVSTIVGEILQEGHKIAGAVDSSDVVLRVNPEVAKVFKSSRTQYLEELEEILKRPVFVQSDATLHQEKFDLA